MVDTLIVQVITAVSLGVGALVGINQLRISWNDKAIKSEERIKNWISKSDERILNDFKENMKVVDGKFNVVDTRIKKDEEDIEDVEDDMKQMVQQFRDMCDKLSKHGYIIDTVIPEFRKLKSEFYNFKNAIDINMGDDNRDNKIGPP